MMAQLAVAQASLPGLTLAEDISTVVRAGLGGVGISESRLTGNGAAEIGVVRESGLRVTLCRPTNHSVLPEIGGGADQPGGGHTAALCASVRRLAAFDPVAISVDVRRGGDFSSQQSWVGAVKGVRSMARTAAALHPNGVKIAVEVNGAGSLLGSLEDGAALIEDAGEPNVRLALVVGGDGGDPDVDILAAHLALIAGVLVNVPAWLGTPGSTASDATESDAGLRSVLDALDRVRYRGWYELQLAATAAFDPVAAMRRARGWFHDQMALSR
jgi:sugar phosphate isomerase/epimerase